MSVRWWLQLVILVASWYNAGTMWMTQVNWRLWSYVGRDDFPAYHRAWWFGWRGIQPVVFPFGILATLGALAQLRWRLRGVPAWTTWAGVALWALTWGSTAAWWGRFQGRLDEVRLEDGSLNPLYRRLLATHWARVGLMTALALLQLGVTAAGISGREATRD